MKKLLLTLFLTIFTMTSWAAMIVDQSVVHFEPGDKTRQDVRITNPEAETMYVKVEILEILNPGEPNEERVEVKDPRKSGFIATPNQIIIPPGQTKLVRLLNVKPLGDKERVFRINLLPVEGKVKASVTGVKLLVGFQLLVLVSPQQPNHDIAAKREGKVIHFENVGNSNVMLHRGKNCPEGVDVATSPDAEGCADITTKRLYPGNKWSLTLEHDTPARYLLSVGKRNESAIY